jgi:hypothetical protein
MLACRAAAPSLLGPILRGPGLLPGGVFQPVLRAALGWAGKPYACQNRACNVSHAHAELPPQIGLHAVLAAEARQHCERYTSRLGEVDQALQRAEFERAQWEWRAQDAEARAEAGSEAAVAGHAAALAAAEARAAQAEARAAELEPQAKAASLQVLVRGAGVGAGVSVSGGSLRWEGSGGVGERAGGRVWPRGGWGALGSPLGACSLQPGPRPPLANPRTLLPGGMCTAELP